MSARILAAVPAALLLLAIAGCAPGSATETGGTGSSGGEAGGGEDSGGGSGLNCEGVDLSGGWDLFVDDALTVDPAGTGPTSLQTADDAIHFVYAADEEFTTYGFELGYISDGSIFPNQSGIAFPDGHPEAPDDNVFTIQGPMAATMVDGGPYAGVLQITRTDSTGTKYIASICVALALSE